MDLLDKKILIWEDTNHTWNNFGEITTEIPSEEVSIDAKLIATWRKSTVREFVEKVVEAITEAVSLSTSDTKIDTFISLVSLINILPLDLKLVWNDDEANLFIALIHDDMGSQFLYKKDIENYGKEIEKIIQYFLDNGIFLEEHDRYIINGSVLNKASFL